MKMFVTKTQYDYFEDGEFVEIMQLDAIGILKKVDDFYWDNYRNFYEVKLTCPSITIEHFDDSYLKIGLYFYGKYILYYLNPSKRLFHKIVDTLEDVKLFLNSYLSGNFQQDLFMKYWETNWRPQRFFKTKKFLYHVNWKRNLWILIFPIIFLIQYILFVNKLLNASPNGVLAFLFFTVFFVFMSGISIFLFFNYYIFSKNLVLKLSRGNDLFYFGEENNLKKYSKNDIVKVTDFGCHATGSRGPTWFAFHVYQFEMKNGEALKFTSLLISDMRLRYKIADLKIMDAYRFIPTLGSTND